MSRNDGRSDLCVVGYYCAWDEEGKTYTLMRHSLDSDATFQKLVAANADGTVEPSEIYGPTGLNATGAIRDEVVAASVWDFKVAPIQADGSRETNYPTCYLGALPPAVEVSFKAASPMATRKFATQGVSPSSWGDPTTAFYRDQVLPAQQSFESRVRLGIASNRPPAP
jgi:hypothetical protein